MILSTFQGITVEQDTQLRRAVEKAGGHYEVVKNTLIERAGDGHAGRAAAEESVGHEFDCLHHGGSSRAGESSERKSRRTFLRFSSARAGSKGASFRLQEIQQLAQLPSKEELISKVMFLLNAPAQRLASVMAAVPRNLAVVTSEAVKANKFGSGGGEEPCSGGETGITELNFLRRIGKRDGEQSGDDSG